jgi:hypothetical protein
MATDTHADPSNADNESQLPVAESYGQVDCAHAERSPQDVARNVSRNEGAAERSGQTDVDQRSSQDTTAGSAAAGAGRDRQMGSAYRAGQDDEGNGVAGASSGQADADVVLVLNGDTFRSQWESIQIGFVDDPGRAVADARHLLSKVVDELVAGFRQQLDGTLNAGDDASTDQLRHMFRRYRVLFERLILT